jgi:hypothetical protein
MKLVVAEPVADEQSVVEVPSAGYGVVDQDVVEQSW